MANVIEQNQDKDISLSVRGVRKVFGSKVVLDNLTFDAKRGEFIVLVGPSGCGKSTMLRSIAGLESVDGGTITIEGKDVTNLVPKDRDIAMVFQDYALYPHKNVYENIAFGLRLRKVKEEELDRMVRDAARKLNLLDLLDRKPLQLSGGQRQRVAIGRAIVRNPKIFLLDEPLSNLDAKLRGSMRLTIALLQKELNTTTVYVTHDQTEAMTLADRVIVLHGGHIQQIGSPLELYYHPANQFVAGFIGSPEMNLLEGKLERVDGMLCFVSSGIKMPILDGLKSFIKEGSEGREVVWGIRPENFRVPKDDTKSKNSVELKVLYAEPLGPSTLCLCSFGDTRIRISVQEPLRPVIGETLNLEWRSRHLYLFDKETGESLVKNH